MSDRNPIYIAAALLVVLNTADIVLTRIFVNQYGVAEANPLTAPIVNTSGLFLFKTVGVAVIAVLVVRYVQARWVSRILFGVVAAYSVVVAWNVLGLAAVHVT